MNRAPFRHLVHLSLCLSVSALSALSAGTAAAQSMPAMPASGAMGKPMAGMHAGISKEMHTSMMSGMDAMKNMSMSGDIDKDFAMMMKMHHQQAIDMAKPEVEHGKSPEIKAMARKIIKDQTKEIAQLDGWLKKHP
ncbi:DUF305 domain-containing protein [Roseateles sp.]|uniref:DUF305 domain-containing protein n=1 Tax=Roseateles sp. TaxID=1971397 RepID=UPI003267B829